MPVLSFRSALLVLLSFRTPVSTTYLLPTAPVFFIGAGVLLDRLAAAEWELRPRWLLPPTVTTVHHRHRPAHAALAVPRRPAPRFPRRGRLAHRRGSRPGDVDLLGSGQRCCGTICRDAEVEPPGRRPEVLEQSVRALREAGRRGALDRRCRPRRKAGSGPRPRWARCLAGSTRTASCGTPSGLPPRLQAEPAPGLPLPAGAVPRGRSKPE